MQHHSEFAKRASQIGLGIHHTSIKVQKLAQLAKRTSMFDDPADEIQQLTGIVKQDIQQLNNQVPHQGPSLVCTESIISYHTRGLR
jgi:syntaxin 5